MKTVTRLPHSKNIEMISGSLWKNILLFSIPLMFSMLLQVVFNMADIAVVGLFSGAQALGSVGSTATLVTLFTGFLIGIGNGVNVRVAHFIGARDEDAVKQTVQTSFAVSGAVGLAIFALCFFLSRPMLMLLNTKPDLIDGAVLYLKIYAFGMPALAFFNFGNAVMSANGDTRRPLFFLTTAGILNLVLNLFFVIVCGMSVDGVALASIISQYLSAFLTVGHLARGGGICRLVFRPFKFSFRRARSILGLGIPAGLQHAVFAVANLFIQGAVNSFDTVTVEGNSAAANADAIIYNLMAAFYTACSAFVGQNLGAGNRKRIRHSYFISVVYSFAIGAVMGLLLLVFGNEFLRIFTKESAVVEMGMQRLRIMAFSYAFSAFMDCTIAAARGIGKSIVPTIIVLLGSCVFRVIWIYTVFAHYHTVPSLYLLYIFSWAITGAAEIIYFIVSFRKLTKKLPT